MQKNYSVAHTKFTAELLAMSMLHRLTIETALQVIVKHGQKFIYGTAKEVGFKSYGTPDPKDYVWCYCADLMRPELPPTLTPII